MVLEITADRFHSLARRLVRGPFRTLLVFEFAAYAVPHFTRPPLPGLFFFTREKPFPRRVVYAEMLFFGFQKSFYVYVVGFQRLTQPVSICPKIPHFSFFEVRRLRR